MRNVLLQIYRTPLTIAVLVVLYASLGVPVYAQIKLDVFVDPHPVVSGGTTGFAFAGNKFVGSVDRDGAKVLYQTGLNGTLVQLFAPGITVPTGSIFAEHTMAGSLGLGGFPLWDIFIATGAGVLHITNDGTHSNMLVTGLANPVRGMVFDTVGTFGHDLIVSTFGGQIYRVNSSGSAQLLASVGEDTEGMDIAPIGAGFGSFDGQLIVVSENSGLLRAISVSGAITVLNENNRIPSPEKVNFVPLDLGATGSPIEGFYVANYPENVLKTAVDQFRSFRGDAIVISELSADHRISRVHWNGESFDISVIGSLSGEAEDSIFVSPRTINPGCPANQNLRTPILSDWCWPNCWKFWPKGRPH